MNWWWLLLVFAGIFAVGYFLERIHERSKKVLESRIALTALFDRYIPIIPKEIEDIHTRYQEKLKGDSPPGSWEFLKSEKVLFSAREFNLKALPWHQLQPVCDWIGWKPSADHPRLDPVVHTQALSRIESGEPEELVFASFEEELKKVFSYVALKAHGEFMEQKALEAQQQGNTRLVDLFELRATVLRDLAIGEFNAEKYESELNRIEESS